MRRDTLDAGVTDGLAVGVCRCPCCGANIHMPRPAATRTTADDAAPTSAACVVALDGVELDILGDVLFRMVRA